MLEVNYNHVLDLTPEVRAQFVQSNEAIFQQMLLNVGDESAIIRDQQNYRLFIQLLSENGIPHLVLHQFVEYLASDKGMLFHIGEKYDNSIFQRAYSALFLTAIVHADRQLQILSQQEIDLIAEMAIDLFKNEQDLRSYVNEDAGWAHAIPNAAELLCAIIQHPNYPIRMTAQILQAIRANLWKDYVYTDDEEERFVMIVESILKKGIDEALVIEWFEQLYEQLEIVAYERGYEASWFKARTNLLNVSKTLYFHLKFSNRHDQLRGIVSMFIQRWLKMN